MKIKNLKVLVVLFVFSLITLSCSDDEKSENLLHNHVWNYGEVTSQFSSNGVNLTINGVMQGNMTFKSDNTYTNNVLGGLLTVTVAPPVVPQQTLPIEAMVEIGNYEHQVGPNKIITRSNTTPSEVSEYYIHEITKSKLILKVKIDEFFDVDANEYMFITLTR